MRRLLPGMLAFLAIGSAAAAPRPEIRIDGAPPELEDNIRAHLSIADEPCDRPIERLRLLRPVIEGEVDAAARALGYYHTRIRKLSWQRVPNCWRLQLQIEAGPRVRIAAIRLQIIGAAASDPEFATLRRHLPIRPGDPLHHGRYQQLKSLFKHLALRRGYFDARFETHELKVDVQRNQAVIHLVFDSGPRYRIGTVTIRQDFLDPAFVQRYLNVKPGKPYQAALLAELYQHLAAADLFQDIDIKTRTVRTPDPRVPITVTLKAKKRHRFNLGIGFDTDTGPRLSFGYLNRYLNRQGHRLTSDLKLSFIEPGLSAGYFIPLSTLEESLSFNGGFRRQRLDTYTSNQGIFNAAYAHPRGAWNEVVRLGLSYEDSHFRKQTGTVTNLLLTPSLHWNHKRQSKPANYVTRGRKLDFLASAGVTLLGDSGHYLKAHLRGKYIFSLPWPGRLLHRWELGTLITSRFDHLPASVRFFAGGNHSVRGFGYQGLGPKNTAGDVIGGRYLGVASLEYDHRILENWGMALFLDAGNAYDRIKAIADQVRFGAGIGLRWFSPVGVVRLDLATPILRDDLRIRIHFALGPEL